VISLAAGRYTETPLAITKPTVIVGGPDVVLSATIASTAGEPLWLEDVAIENAPFPGAIFASHPSSETTLVRVRIDGAHGVGVIHDGGILSMYDTVIRRTKHVRRVTDRRVDKAQVRSGFGQPEAIASPTRLPSPPTNFSALDDLVVRDVGPSFSTFLKVRLAVPSYEPVGAADDPRLLGMVSGDCTGVGAIVYGTLGYLSDTNYFSNARAGLVVSKSTVHAVNVFAFDNGISGAIDDSDPAGLVAGLGCFGGIQVTGANSSYISEGGGASSNAPTGLFARKQTVVTLGTWTGGGAESPSGAWGHNIQTSEGFLSLTDFLSEYAFSAGVVFDNATGNVYSGRSSHNRFGLVNTTCPGPYIADAVKIRNNTQENVHNQCDVVPEGPEQLPQ
jgi:hypothetical protein